jgi:hypothetical protein
MKTCQHGVDTGLQRYAITQPKSLSVDGVRIETKADSIVMVEFYWKCLDCGPKGKPDNHEEIILKYEKSAGQEPERGNPAASVSEGE